MDEEMILCRVCSLPSPTNVKECIHCKSPLQKSLFENNIREMTIIMSISYVIMWILYFLTKAPEMRTILMLIKIEIISLIVIDLLFLDRSLHQFKNLKRVLHHRAHRWLPYLFYESLLLKIKK